MLVLAGPGTGKTTTLVESVVDRIERRGVPPEQVLVLTFSRRAADEMRQRIAARLERTVATPLATTFHSFCYGLVRELQDPKDYAEPMQLLSAAEADHRVRELLEGAADGVRHPWPARLLPALRTHGFAVELQRLAGRARALGLDPVDLATTGSATGRTDWVAAAHFFEEYLDVLDAQNMLDYAELVHRARLAVEDHRGELAERFSYVVVDEFQDTDPAQVALLEALCGGGRDLVAVGDPDQSIYAFRGAEVRGVWEFPGRFAAADGRPAPVRALRRTRRFGPRLLAASKRVADRIGLGTLPLEARGFRDTVPTPAAHLRAGDDELWLATFTDPAAEAEHVAQLLRRAHLEEGTPWDEMAVLVRGGAAMGRLHRALVAAGVPVEVAGSEVPLRAEPAVGGLLAALELAVTLAEEARPDPEAVEALLTGPLGHLDGADLRVLCRELRRRDAFGDDGERRPPRPSTELLVDALVEPGVLAGLRGGRVDDVARRARRVADLVRRCATLVAQHASPEVVLWTLWRGTAWERRLLDATAAGGEAAAAAHRDLDAVVALFALAARSEET
ncbi:UNVERIFIED_CONTAM: hypothetical protein LK11_58810, partial [Mumia flava]